jgi:hypothetical protein
LPVTRDQADSPETIVLRRCSLLEYCSFRRRKRNQEEKAAQVKQREISVFGVNRKVIILLSFEWRELPPIVSSRFDWSHVLLLTERFRIKKEMEIQNQRTPFITQIDTFY